MRPNRALSNSRRKYFAAGALAAWTVVGILGAGCGDTGMETSTGTGTSSGSETSSGTSTGTGMTEAICSDGIKNGGESDVDCGGPCAPCADGQGCTDGASCASGVCTNGTCRPPTCSDGVQNGNETSVDCGGSCAEPETCNGKDDDCNGMIDDGIASITCGVGTCQKTVPGCTSGQPSKCEPDAAGTEVCDGLLDENCDGQVDDGCSCQNGNTQACYTGTPSTMDVGVCRAGNQTCANGSWGSCAGEVTPADESCNGIDDDCNGVIDDGLASLTCGVGACAVTVPACVNGMPTTCTPGQPTNESCNGIDDDCNGVIDDGNPGGGQSCNTGNLGACAAGTTTCSSGAIICAQNVPAAPSENCGTPVDDNCNGQVNEGCVCAPFSTQTCYSGTAGTAGVGICRSGTRTCNASGTGWGPCMGEVTPGTESCQNNLDDNCNGQVNEGCSSLTCQDFYVEDFNDGNATELTSGVYQVDWCNSYVATSANTPLCMAPGQTTRTNANGGTNTFVGIWVHKATASCSAVRLSYEWYQFANAGAVVEYKQTTDAFASYSSCSSSSGWTTAVPSSSMSTVQTCSSTTNINIPFGNAPAVYIKFKSTNSQNNAMWWDDIKLTLVGCDCG